MTAAIRNVLSQTELEARLVRYGDLAPCREAFIDRRTPGCEGNENFTIIGPGVAEAANQHVHIGIPHGFNIGGARQEPGASNSQHSHEKEEVFVVHTGTFAFHLGPNKEDGSVVLGPGDTISVPIRVFRGFENVGPDTGYLFAVLGGDDPGSVTWAPYVLNAARGTGLVLLEDGRLIDTEAGEQVPAGAREMRPLSDAELAVFRRVRADDAASCVVKQDRLQADDNAPLCGPGVAEYRLIGPANAAENLSAAPIDWPHGFHLRRVRLAAGACVQAHSRVEAEVLFVHRGQLTINWPNGEIDLRQGDHLTLPAGFARGWRNSGSGTVDIVVVHAGDHPGAPVWDAA